MPAGSDGLTMIALTPAEIRWRMSSSWPAASVLRCAMLSELTSPEASACALIEQIISSRQPLPATVLETPMVYGPAAKAGTALMSALPASSARVVFLSRLVIFSPFGWALVQPLVTLHKALKHPAPTGIRA